MPELPTGTVTLLFTDIEGSTRLVHEMGQDYEHLLAKHHELLRAVFERWRGREVATQGDAFFVAFQSASDALAATVEGQRALLAHDWRAAGALRVRMGLHTGEPTLVEDDYVGLDVHRAARICSAAHGGQIVLSKATREWLHDMPPADVELRDLGHVRLKDLPRPERLYQVTAAELPAEFPPLRSLDLPKNVPATTTSMVGRDAELAAVRALLGRPGVRLVTLTGPGGTGKTRLALALAGEPLPEYEDGVFFVALAPLVDAELVEAAVAGALGVEEVAGQSLTDSLVVHLRDKHLLLVLDNFEHVLEATPLVVRMLSAAERLEVVVTSRAPLHISGEHEFPVPPLSLPTSTGRSVDALAHSEAVELFVERALSVRHDFELNESNAPAVAEICARLDGLPLAIELAAARMKILSPAGILDRLDRRQRVLTSALRDAPTRQQTLEGAIDWSYNLLSPDEQHFFRQLSVFAGGSTIEAAQEVVDAPCDAFDALCSLTDNSLLLREEGHEDEPRFSMLRTIREYARAAMEREGEAEAARSRHAQYFLDLAEAADPALTGPDQASWFARLEADHDNMRAALEWALAGEEGSDETEVALRLAGAMGWFWYAQGRAIEGSRWIEAALDKAPHDLNVFRARCLHTLGVLLEQRRHLPRAIGLLEEALEIFRRIGDKNRMARSLNSLGVALRSQGDAERQRALLQESLDLRREVGDRKGMATALSNLGIFAMDVGDNEGAVTLFEQSLELDREARNDWGVAVTTHNLAVAIFELGDVEEARRMQEGAARTFEELGDKDSLAESLELAAGLASANGQAERAARLSGAAERLREEIGSPLLGLDQDRLERYLASSKAELGARFETMLDEGRQMSLRQALDYALGSRVRQGSLPAAQTYDLGKD